MLSKFLPILAALAAGALIWLVLWLLSQPITPLPAILIAAVVMLVYVVLRVRQLKAAMRRAIEQRKA